MKILMGIMGSISVIILILFIQEIRNELEEERWWRNRGKSYWFLSTIFSHNSL